MLVEGPHSPLHNTQTGRAVLPGPQAVVDDLNNHVVSFILDIVGSELGMVIRAALVKGRVPDGGARRNNQVSTWGAHSRKGKGSAYYTSIAAGVEFVAATSRTAMCSMPKVLPSPYANTLGPMRWKARGKSELMDHSFGWSALPKSGTV